MEDKGIPIRGILDKEIQEKIMRTTSLGISYPDIPNTARQFAEIEQALEERDRYNARKDAVIFQAAEESKKQNKLLSEQIETLKEQNRLLNGMYEAAKTESEENKKQARHSQLFGWISFAVGTVIGIAGVLVGIFI